MNSSVVTLDGFGPLPLVRPESVHEVGDLVRHAAASNSAIYPLGGQTKIALGNVPTRPGHAVDLRGLDQVVDFPARDMTITVQTAITIRSLREIAGKEKLRLPIDVAQADRATLGGIIATNTSGPRRLGYGTLRDYVIGISALNDAGSEFKAGGRVVKNVAGYDLCKLLVGSLGTLGVITQATLKLRPLAEQQAIVCVGCEPTQLDALLTGLHGSRTRPVCVDLLNRNAAQAVFAQAQLAAPEAAWTLLVGYEGNADAVSWEVQQLVKELGPQGRLDAWIDFSSGPLWQALVEFAAAPEGGMVLKARMLPSATAAFCQAVDQDPDRPAIQAHAGTGIVFGHWPPGLTKGRAGSILTTWRNRAGAGNGTVTVLACPSEWKSSLSVWGLTPSDAWLLREVKAAFDPKGIFNPGRFVDGI
ncbi:MAG: FAD-binding oxidoreductase [Planctomycetes bacterium]|nr:FAD-binding oxidoreductase [Planctomycetota bacterium]